MPPLPPGSYVYELYLLHVGLMDTSYETEISLEMAAIAAILDHKVS